MPTELVVQTQHLGGMKVRAEADGYSLLIDYPLEAGAPVEGMTSLHLLLASLASCAANGVRLLLERRLGQTLTSLRVEARAQRRDEHPTVLTGIDLVFRIGGPGLDSETAARALHGAETQLCPVWAMLASGTPIRTRLDLSGEA